MDSNDYRCSSCGVEQTLVKLNAKKIEGSIIISNDSFEHLLNCLDNQKFVPLPHKQSELEKKNIQKYIDDFNYQCRRLLNKEEEH